MVKSSRGFRNSTRSKFRKKYKDKFTITPYLQEFKQDQKVVIKPNPSSQKSLPHRRFQGMIGIIKGQRGNSYIVDLKIGKVQKTIISRPEHLKLHKG